MFKDRLRALRKERAVSQQELASSIFVSRSAVAKWENGLGLPSRPSYEALLAYFGVTEEQFPLNEATEIEAVEHNVKMHIVKNIVFWVIATIVMSLFLIALIVILVKQFKGIKKMDHSGEMEFTEKGIWDISKHSKFFWKWELVDYVVIGKYAYTFVMKEYPYLFSLPVSLEKDINKSLKKLKIKIDIIDKRK